MMHIGGSLKSNGTADTLAGSVPTALTKTTNGLEKPKTVKLFTMPLELIFVNRMRGVTASEQTFSVPL